jgi:hypothetical protein
MTKQTADGRQSSQREMNFERFAQSILHSIENRRIVILRPVFTLALTGQMIISSAAYGRTRFEEAGSQINACVFGAGLLEVNTSVPFHFPNVCLLRRNKGVGDAAALVGLSFCV